MKQPKAKVIPKALTIHDDTRIDNYYWLNERDNPSVIAYLEAENAYREASMMHTKPLQETLFNEIVGRIAQTDMSVPYHYNGYWYYNRFEEGSEYAIQCRKKANLDAPEEILLDVPTMAKQHAYFALGHLSVSPDNKWLAYGVDTVSRRLFTIYFKNLETGETLSTCLTNTTGYAAWAADNKTIFYTLKDETTLRAYKIAKHTLGTDPSVDKLIFEEKDETFICYVVKSKSEKYLMIGSHATVSTEYRILNADTPDGVWQVFEPRQRDHEYNIEHAGSYFYVVTNYKAKNFRLMRLSDTEGVRTKDLWQEVIPHRTDVLLESIEVFKNWLVLSERFEGLKRLRCMRWDGTDEHLIDFKEEVAMAYAGFNPDYETDKIRVGFTSLTTPNSVFEYNMSERVLILLKQTPVIDNDFKTENYTSKRLYATATDGVKIPISLVYRKGLFKKRRNPMLLYAYGSYGHSIDPYFSSARLSLLNRGFVFAIAHIRGGEEMGRAWYDDGKLLKKKNTFTDFIACAELLIAEGFTKKSALFAMGGSAGGLLMGAVANLRPDLWRGIVAAVPFVDVVTTMLDESIPLTTGEFDEWGNPKDKTYYDYIKSYSPYDNVERKAYPPMLITTGLNDSQVQYWEPAKWIAKLRALRTNKRTPLYMFCNMDTGHGGASGRFQYHRETAMEYAFLLGLAGIKK